MQLTPITPIQPLDAVIKKDKTASATAQSAQVPFRSMFEEAVQNVKSTQADVDQEIYKIVTGQTDDLHNYGIAATKAATSVELLTQIRNKTLDAYNEIMRISV